MLSERNHFGPLSIHSIGIYMSLCRYSIHMWDGKSVLPMYWTADVETEGSILTKFPVLMQQCQHSVCCILWWNGDSHRDLLPKLPGSHKHSCAKMATATPNGCHSSCRRLLRGRVLALQWVSSSLRWLFCQHRLENLHVRPRGPTWKIGYDSGGHHPFSRPVSPTPYPIPQKGTHHW